MTFFSPAVLVAVLGGVAIAFQSLFSGVIGSKVGVFESVFIVHAGGLLLAAAIMAFLRGGNLGAWHTVPWYTLTAGFLGVAIVGTISYTVPRIGLASTLTVAIAAQLAIGALLDHFGLLGAMQRTFDLPRIAGLVALALGTWLVVR
ncbi:MAG: DMT family transporter [Candidatus Bipolaricaulota bacterium]